MYITGKLEIKELLFQLGLEITPYDTKFRIEHSYYDRSKIKSAHINTYGPRKYPIANSMVFNFNENKSVAKFNTTFIMLITEKDVQYPIGLKVIKINQETFNQFTEIEDAIKLLYILSNKKINHVYINITGDMTFPENNPIIENIKIEIESRIIHEYFKDNHNNLKPCEYLKEKLSENAMIYDHEKMTDIVATFEMLVI